MTRKIVVHVCDSAQSEKKEIVENAEKQIECHYAIARCLDAC